MLRASGASTAQTRRLEEHRKDKVNSNFAVAAASAAVAHHFAAASGRQPERPASARIGSLPSLLPAPDSLQLPLQPCARATGGTIQHRRRQGRPPQPARFFTQTCAVLSRLVPCRNTRLQQPCRMPLASPIVRHATGLAAQHVANALRPVPLGTSQRENHEPCLQETRLLNWTHPLVCTLA